MARLRVLDTAVRANTKHFEKGMKRAGRLVRRFAGVISVYLGARALKQQAAALDRVAKASDKLGIASERLMGLHHAAELSGVSVRTFDMAIQRMTRRVAEAAMGTGEARGAIKELGLDAKELKKLAPDEMLRDIADAMEGVGSQADRVRLAMKLFDSEGVALVNTLALGRKGLDAAQKEMEDLGATMSREELRNVEAMNDNLTRLGQVAQAIGNQILKATAPIVNYAAEMMGLSKATDEALIANLRFERSIIEKARSKKWEPGGFGFDKEGFFTGTNPLSGEEFRTTWRPGFALDWAQQIKNIDAQIREAEARIAGRTGKDVAGGGTTGGIDTITAKVSNLEQTGRAALQTISGGFDVMTIKAQGFGAVLDQILGSLMSMASQTFAQHLMSKVTGGFVPSPLSVDQQRAAK